MGFKKDFVWGAATSSYQIEGAYNEDGRGMSIWDVYSHEPVKVFGNHTGDTACEHYHRFKEDVALMKKIGIKAYRFSVSWSRIIPDGTGAVNEKGIAFYSELINELKENNIEPYITLFHWDLPYELHKRGGWMNPDSVKWFADYAALVVARFSDRVTNFITFNEPQCFIGLGYYKAEHAPGLRHPVRDVFEMSHNVLKAHGAAVIAMRKSARQNIKIGYAPTGTAAIPVSESAEDIAAARKLMFECPALENWTWNVSWWSDPVVLGHYPEEGLRKYKDYLPEITEEDMRLINQPIDFYGQNIYQGVYVKAGENGEPEVVEHTAGYAKTAIQWPVTPECLRWGPQFLYERYRLPIYITENGMSAHDVISLDGNVHDPNRIDFLARHLEQLEKAADGGTDVAGYFQWSLMDNYEWACGYSERFGLIYVDYETQQRIIKDSGYWYKTWIENHS
ncbi:MAG: GH1 family beta-glucosidase [Clostridiales bacterium]|nr:GH1 family beta-glucosidase [Clostridiales bacterium]